MTTESENAVATLRRLARAYPEVLSGERAAWDVLQNLRHVAAVDFADCFVRLDGSGRIAVVRLLSDLASGKTGLVELR